MSRKLIGDLGWKTELASVPKNLPHLVHSDSRSISPGQWFVPIVGPSFDAHTFIPEVLAKGAQGFLFARSRRGLLDAQQLSRGIEVEDTTQALQELARWWREQQACKLIGITGSSGKTSVKELTFAMLQAVGPSLKTEGSLNNELGVPLTLCRLQRQHRFAVIEMGARHRGDIDFLSRIVQQDVGVLVNVGTAHVGEFGGVDQILAAKMEIARAPHCVFLRDNPAISQSMYDLKNKHFVSFGYHSEADVRIMRDDLDGSGNLQLTLEVRGTLLTLQLPYYHQSYPLNVACALAIGLSLELPLTACLPGLQTFQGVKGRFQVHQLKKFTLIDDAYNANPQSMLAGLETVSRAYRRHAKVLILGDMKELGDHAEQAHREIGTFCANEVKPLRLITVGIMGEWIAKSARDAGLQAAQLKSFADVDSLLPHLPELCQDAQVLYVKASNSLRLSKIIDTFLLK